MTPTSLSLSTPGLDQVAAAIRDARQDCPDELVEAAASELIAVLRDEVPALPDAAIGAVLMHVGLLADHFLVSASAICGQECALSRFSDAAAVAGVRLYGGEQR